MKRTLIVVLLFMSLFSMVILSCSQTSTSTNASGTNTSAWTGENLTLSCGATFASNVSGCNITLACKTPVDLSSINNSSGNNYICCVSPAKLPKNSSGDNFAVATSVCQ